MRSLLQQKKDLVKVYVIKDLKTSKIEDKSEIIKISYKENQ
jgi:hypothetical protein